MMLVKTDNIDAVMEFLNKEEIINLNIKGIIRNIRNCEIYVNEDITGVYVKNGYFNYIFSKEDNFIEDVFKSFKNNFYGFSGIYEPIAKKIKDEFDLTWENKCTLYYMPKENLDTSKIKNEVTSIKLEDANIVNDFYEYKNDYSLEMIKTAIKERPSSALYIDGEIVSWCIIHEDNSMGIMYTKKEHRRKGYGIDVAIDLANKVFINGDIPFIHIIKDNKMSPPLADACGFVEYTDVSWFGIIEGVPNEIIEVNNELTKSHKNNVEQYKENNAMFLFSDNIIKTDITMEVTEVTDNDTLNVWIDTYKKNKKTFNIDIKSINEKYQLFIGYIENKPVATMGILNYIKDEDCKLLCFLSGDDDYIKEMTYEVIKDKEDNLIIVHEKNDIFKDLGFKDLVNNE